MNLQSIEAFLELVADPKKYAKYIKDIKDEQDRLAEMVTAVGKISEINRLHEEAEAKYIEAELKVQYANDQAEEIKANVIKDISNRKETFKEYAKNTKVKKQKAEALLAEADRVSEEVRKEKEEVEKLREQTEEALAKAKQTEAYYKEKVSKLQAVF